MKRLAVAVAVAFLLWFVMFSPLTGGTVNFWLAMSLSAVILLGMAFFADKKGIVDSVHFSWKDLLTGVVSAAVLWGIFWLGNFLSTKMFDFASGQIGSVYAMKDGCSQPLIAVLLLLLIGPAEEVFWHGFVQRKLSEKYGFFLTVGVTVLIYSAVHVPSLNFMLVMAALVCGAFWSTIYYFNRNLFTVIVSHSLWDCAVFVVFPIV